MIRLDRGELHTKRLELSPVERSLHDVLSLAGLASVV
jgi:hypothetical protein